MVGGLRRLLRYANSCPYKLFLSMTIRWQVPLSDPLGIAGLLGLILWCLTSPNWLQLVSWVNLNHMPSEPVQFVEHICPQTNLYYSSSKPVKPVRYICPQKLHPLVK